MSVRDIFKKKTTFLADTGNWMLSDSEEVVDRLPVDPVDIFENEDCWVPIVPREILREKSVEMSESEIAS